MGYSSELRKVICSKSTRLRGLGSLVGHSQSTHVCLSVTHACFGVFHGAQLGKGSSPLCLWAS